MRSPQRVRAAKEAAPSDAIWRCEDKQIDELLDVISKGLSELKEIAVDIGNNLEVQNERLDEVHTRTVADRARLAAAQLADSGLAG